MLQKTQFTREREIWKDPIKRTGRQSTEKVELIKQEHVRTCKKIFSGSMKILNTIKSIKYEFIGNAENRGPQYTIP